jgi:hypothetical protein
MKKVLVGVTAVAVVACTAQGTPTPTPAPAPKPPAVVTTVNHWDGKCHEDMECFVVIHKVMK